MKKRLVSFPTLITTLLLMVWPAAHAASVSGSNTGNVSIPDGSPGAWVSSQITISGAPAGATVTGIDVYFRCVHPFSGDLVVDLNADSTGSLGNRNLWNREGGAADNPSRTVTGISTFNGLSVNRTWYLYARDYATGDSGYIDEWTITVYYADATPTITSVSPNPLTGANTASTLTVNGSGFVSGATVRLRCPAFGVDSTRSATFINSGQLQVSATFGTDPSSWTAQVINPSTAVSSQFGFTVQAPVPAITSLSPSSASAGGAAFTLRVNGNTFHQGSVVRWNGANRTTTPVVSGGGLTTALDAQITASDIASSGTATVTVNSPGPGGGTSSGATFTINAIGPSISSVSPNPLTGANTASILTVNGAGFVSGATVRLRCPAFGVDSTRSATFINSGQLQISATFGTDPSAWTAQVINPNTMTSSQFGFTVQAPAPAITSLSPSSTSAGGGAFTLRVNGDTFHQTSVVRWNGANRTTTPVVSAGGLTTALDAQITASDIASAGTATVTVNSPGPGGGTSAGATFTINAGGPTISSLSPNPLTGANTATILTVNGSGFVSGATVRLRCPVFGVDSTRPTTFINGGQLQVSATFGTDPSSWTAQVINPSTAASSEFNFSVQAPSPVITSLSPSSATAGGAAFTLRVNGSTFHQASVVRWNGANRTTTPVVSAGGLTTALDAQITTSDIASAGSATVTVNSPGPGGGTSAGATFTIGGGGGFAVPLTEDLIPEGRNNRPGPMTANYITIHDTDNTSVGANALMHANYVKNPSTGGDCDAGTGMPNNPDCPKSWHFTVDDHEAYQHLPTSEHGWHAGDGANGPGNRQSVGVEICMNSDGNRAQAEENAAWLAAKLLRDLNLSLSQVKQHNHWSGKNCPSVLRGRVGGWDGFLARVDYYLNQSQPATRPVIASPILSGAIFTLNVPSETGFNYVLEYKNTLNDANWIPVQTNSGSGGTIGLTNNGATGLSRMYRVRVE